MSKLGLLGGLGAGMSQVGQNMFEQAKLDRINEFRMKVQQGQNKFSAKENAANRQQRAELQADQQSFTAKQAQLNAANNLKVAQAKGVKPDWQKVELADGSVIFVDPNTGEQKFVSSNPVMHAKSNAAIPTGDFHNTSSVNGTSAQGLDDETQQGSKEELAKKARAGLLSRNNSLGQL